VESDEELAHRVRDGDETAFVALIRRHERPLAALVRNRIGSVDSVPDVLQETLLQVWTGLRHHETPKRVRPWILQVARNRCRDFLRSRQRREIFVGQEVLDPIINRLGLTTARLRERAGEVVEAFTEVSEHEREALRSFYLDGLTIAEIAARHRCPTGTVKRRLSQGRDHIRSTMGVTPTRRSATMQTEQTHFPEYTYLQTSSAAARVMPAWRHIELSVPLGMLLLLRGTTTTRFLPSYSPA